MVKLESRLGSPCWKAPCLLTSKPWKAPDRVGLGQWRGLFALPANVRMSSTNSRDNMSSMQTLPPTNIAPMEGKKKPGRWFSCLGYPVSVAMLVGGRATIALQTGENYGASPHWTWQRSCAAMGFLSAQVQSWILRTSEPPGTSLGTVRGELLESSRRCPPANLPKNLAGEQVIGSPRPMKAEHISVPLLPPRVKPPCLW